MVVLGVSPATDRISMCRISLELFLLTFDRSSLKQIRTYTTVITRPMLKEEGWNLCY